jgi:uncharacterized membrane protein (UPF0127 family)
MPARDGSLYKIQNVQTGTTYSVEVVTTLNSRAKGLSGRQSLAPGWGMLFVFDSLAPQAMWMKGMLFPLDIVWLDEQMSVVNLYRSCPPCKEGDDCMNYSSGSRVLYGLELPAGAAAADGLRIGHSFRVL